MKLHQLIVFLTVVFTLYIAGNYYIFIRGLQALPNDNLIRTSYKIIFLFLFLSFIAGRFIERIFINDFSQITIWAGNFWLGAMLYLILSILLLDIIRFSNNIFHYFPDFINANYPKVKLIAFAAVTISTILILLFSFINANSPRVTELNININKKANKLKNLNIVLASDIHLGSVISKSELSKLINMVNSLNPDIILLAGDVVDEDLAPVIKHNLGEDLTKFKSKYGVFAITGNHEYIGGAEKAVKYIEEHGVKYLRDENVKIDDSFWLIGREDRDSERFSGKKRKNLNELIEKVDKSLPIIVMNHQPFNLNESSSLGVDLHLSGHTHHGQIWPFNYITKKVYEVSWGYKLINNTHVYVSSGFGTWGPPIRSANHPEIVHIIVSFK